MQDFAEDLAARSQAIMDRLQSVRVRPCTPLKVNIFSDFRFFIHDFAFLYLSDLGF